jgi:glycosyltransferase involved in cell wall biosynthesis
MGGPERGAASEQSGLHVSGEYKRRPAIGVIAFESDFGEIARTLIEVNKNEFFSFVAFDDSDDSAIADLCRQLDAGVMQIDANEMDDTYDTVEKTARVFGFPGILFHDPTDGRIDFEACERTTEATERYGTYAPTVETGKRESSVVAAIPAYNEEATIGEVVHAVREHTDEVLIVDDGSTDDTVEVAEGAGGTVVEHDRNRGYGAALKTAFEEADRRSADVLVTLDGDGQHDADEIPKLVREHWTTDADIVIGSRFCDDTTVDIPLYRRLGLSVINLLTNLSMGVVRRGSWVSDTQSGFRVFGERAIRSIAADDRFGDGMSASTDFLYHAHRHGYRIEEVGSQIQYDDNATSTRNPLVHGATLVSNILKTIERERPLTFLGIPGMGIVLSGIGLGYWTVLNYLEYQSFSAGIALLCLLFLFLGTLLSITSIILHALNRHIETLENSM